VKWISAQLSRIAVSLLTALCTCVEEIVEGPCGRHAFFLRDVPCVHIAGGALKMAFWRARSDLLPKGEKLLWLHTTDAK